MIMGFCERCLVHHEVGVCPSEMPPEFFSETPPVSTPKAQAEAMAQEIRRKHAQAGTMINVAELEASISTALEKLLAENERLKEHAFESANRELHLNEQLSAFKSERNLLADYHTTAMCERDEARERLTATEARLEIARGLLFLSTSYVAECSEISISGSSQCGASELLPKIDAFLSTLTAEKKEQG